MVDLNLKEKMTKAIEHLDFEFQGIRTGRAHPAMLDTVKVDYYGSMVPIKQLATVTIPDSRTLQISPFDKGSTKAIEKAILAANIGMTPNVDGTIIRLTVPEMTGERRKEFVKLANQAAEDARIVIRNLRRDANDTLNKMEKASEISEDELHRMLDKVQETTDKFIANVDDAFKNKEKDILGD